MTPIRQRHEIVNAPLVWSRWVCLAICVMAAFSGLWPGMSLAQTSDRAGQFATLVADSLFIDNNQRLIAQGNVEVFTDDARLRATRVSYDRATDRVLIEGPITLSQGPDIIILADQADLSPDFQRGLIRSARVVFDQQLQIAAHTVTREDGRFTEMTSVVASSCEVCAESATPLWEIRAQRVVHDEVAQQVYFDNAQFRMFGLPVVYIPRLRVPDPRMNRATGFLSPNFILDSGHGIGLRAPYFIVLSQDRDLLVTPFLGSKGTRALELRYRQAFANGMLELGGLVARDSIRSGSTRAAGMASGNFTLNRGYELKFNLVQPTDRQVLEDYGRSESRLVSDVTVERVQRDSRQRFQILQLRSLRIEDVGRSLPRSVGQAILEQRADMPGLGGVGSFRLEANLHRRNQGILPPGSPAELPRQTGQLSLDLEWRRDAILPGGVVGAVGGQLGLDHFRLADTGGVLPTSTSHVTPNLMAELRWPLVRTGLDGVSHVIEPVAQVIWGRDRTANIPNVESRMPELDEGNLYSFNRFAARDARESGLRANLGITWTRHDPDGWTSKLTLGRVYRARDLGQFSSATPLSGARSDWLVAASIGEADGLQVSNRSLISSDMRLQRTALELDWTAEDYSVSTSYMRIIANPDEGRSRTASEWSFEGSRDLSEFWTAQVGWRYDIAQNKAAHALFGLQYENECLRMAMGVERRFASASTPSSRTSLGLNIDILGIGGNPTRARRSCSDGL